jgi:transposase
MLRPTPAAATRPWSPLSDPEWAAIAPLLPRSRHPALRHRLNCILAVAGHATPWVPAGAQGPFWPTVYRHFHRWARAGAWARLHRATEDPAAPPALRALADWAAALHRRAARIAPPPKALNSSNPKPVARQTRPAPGFAPIPRAVASMSLGRLQASIASNPKVPTRGVQRPFGLWRGGSEGQGPFDLPLLDTHPAQRQFAATGKGNGRHDATA